MARVDFYVLAAAGPEARWQFACRLTEKAYKLEHRVRLLARDRGQAERLDELLWTWRDGSFVPHGIEGSPGAAKAPVIVGFGGEAAGGNFDLLINLSDSLPEGLDAFPRIAEIVTSDEETKRRSRDRYASYRERGDELETHKL